MKKTIEALGLAIVLLGVLGAVIGFMPRDAAAQVVPSGGGFSIAGQGQSSSGKTIRCSPASATDAGCVTAGDQTLAGRKTLSGSLILDGGAGYALKTRGVCFQANANIDPDPSTCSNGAPITSPSSGQLDVGAYLSINSTGAYYTAPLLTNTTYFAYGNTATPGLSFYNGSYIDLAGAATGSLPTCNAGNAGIQQYDTTTNTYKFCNGSAWASFSTVAAKSANLLTSVCFNATDCAEGVNFVGATKLRDGATAFQVTCAWGAAGAGGSTGVVVRLRNITAASTLCTCTLGACNTAAATPLSCSCSGAMVPDEEYALQLDSTTDCSAGNNPGQIVCNLTNAN